MKEEGLLAVLIKKIWSIMTIISDFWLSSSDPASLLHTDESPSKHKHCFKEMSQGP